MTGGAVIWNEDAITGMAGRMEAASADLAVTSIPACTPDSWPSSCTGSSSPAGTCASTSSS